MTATNSEAENVASVVTFTGFDQDIPALSISWLSPFSSRSAAAARLEPGTSKAGANPVSAGANPVSVHHSCPKRRTDTGLREKRN